MVSLEFLPITSSAAEEASGMWYKQTFRTLPLTQMQDPFNICAAVLDDDCWALDTVEDPQHQGRPLLGLADKTRNHCRVGTFAYNAIHIADFAVSLPGTPLWIAFTYSDMSKVQNINKFFAPAGW
jgi:hypothetical protein